MADPSSDELVAAHVTAISARTHAEADQLRTTLVGRSWPGGDDRCVPGALEWLRQWRPGGPLPVALPCGCASGRCLLCN